MTNAQPGVMRRRALHNALWTVTVSRESIIRRKIYDEEMQTKETAELISGGMDGLLKLLDF